MVGINLVTRCPYCGKLLFENIGVTKYYKYKGKTTRIDSHCGKRFIPDDREDITLARYEMPLRFKRQFPGSILHIITENLTDDMSEEIIEKIVFDNLYNDASIHDEDIENNVDNIKCVIQAIVGQINIQSFNSIPLTKEIENELEYATTICW